MDVTDKVSTYDLPWSYGGYNEPLSVHVVETDEATVLFGTGTEDTADDLLESIDGHDVDIALVEHGDIDHYGGVPSLREELDIEVAVPAGDADFLEAAGIAADHLLEAGESYWDIETISAPGHTPDNMAYLHDDLLVAGDTVCGSDSPFRAEGDWPGRLAPLAAELNNDDSLTLRSISNLLEYEFEMVLTSHGQNTLSDGHSEVAKLVESLD